MSTPGRELTQCLQDAAQGIEGASERLLPLVYDELRRMAGEQMRGELPGHTLQPTALVHEAWLRLTPERDAGDRPVEWDHRGHFFAAAAHAMRRILVDRARARLAGKRGGGRGAAGLDPVHVSIDETDPDWVLDLDGAVRRLEERHPRQARVVVLRYYAGLSVPETAAALGVSVGSVERDWRLARARLARELDV